MTSRTRQGSKRKRQAQRRCEFWHLRATRKDLVTSQLAHAQFPQVLANLIIGYAQIINPVFFGLSAKGRLACYHYDIERNLWTWCGIPPEEFRGTKQSMLNVYLMTGKKVADLRDLTKKWNVAQFQCCAVPSQGQVFLFPIVPIKPDSVRHDTAAIRYDLQTKRESRVDPGWIAQCVLATSSQLFVIETSSVHSRLPRLPRLPGLPPYCRFKTFWLATGTWKDGPSLPFGEYFSLLCCRNVVVVFAPAAVNFCLELSRWEQWERRESPFEVPSSVSAVVCAGAIYLYSQLPESSHDFWEFEPWINCWRSLSHLPEFQVCHAFKYCDFKSLEKLFP